MVDAEAAVRLGTNWSNLGPVVSVAQSVSNLTSAITSSGTTNLFTFAAPDFRVEHATVTLTTTHPYWGDIVVTLISPSGYRSLLSTAHACNYRTDYKGWTLSSVRHWGEKGDGTWKVVVADSTAGNNGVLNALTVTLYGSLPAPALALDNSGAQPVITLRAAAAGWAYALETSSDLSQWTPLAGLTLPGAGSVSYTDSANDGQAARFYRARLK